MRSLFTLTLLLLATVSLSAQTTGTVTGRVIDGSLNEPLAYANVVIEQPGAPIGTVTDLNGNYRLDKVPAGSQVLVITFLGFGELRKNIEVPAGSTLEVPDQTMQMGSVMGEEIVVTGQLVGQRAALNQQANSNTIVNVVSREKIQELPDVNAAESIGRLPGVTISRNGGEGSKVTVRGVSPRFNSVTVNGQQLPSIDGSNRSVDLSLISSDILQGIEVFKAITPDMDGDAIGGSINLITKTADAGFDGRVQLETGYHQLIEDIGTYKGSFQMSNRYFGDKFGLILGGSAHRADRSTDQADASYESQDLDSEGNRIVTVRSLFMDVRRETRDRYSGSLTADWKLGKEGQIVFDHLYSETLRDILTRSVRMTPDQSRYNISLGVDEQAAVLNSSQLRGKHPLKFMTVDWALSRSKTRRDLPVNYGTSAEQLGAYAPFSFDTPVREIPSFAEPSIEEIVGGNGIGWSENETIDRNLTGQLDLKIPFNAGNLINGFFKVGGKIRDKERSQENRAPRFIDPQKYNNAFIANFPQYVRDDGVFKFSNFADPEFKNYRFQGKFDFVIPFHIDPDKVAQHYAFALMQDSLIELNPRSTQNNYSAKETITAGYAMAQVNVGKKLMILPGVRYENTFNDYTGKAGFVSGNVRNIVLRDTSASISRGALLPMVHLRYKVNEELSLRLAATRTLTRPNFTRLAPFTFTDFLDKEPSVRYGSMDLLIPTAWNYDLVLAHYSRAGLFSVSGFYKKIYDVDIDFDNIDLSGTRQTNPTYGYRVTNPINLMEPTTVYGVELEVQTSTYYLPKPFDALTFGLNLSLVHSETTFPFFYQELQLDPDTGLPVFVAVDTTRTGRLAGQAGVIFNGTIGYEKGGFSGRVSVNYQADKLRSINANPLFDVFEGEFLRWDAVISQKITPQWMVMLNLVNLNNALETSYNGSPEFPSLEVNYGFIAQLGVRYRFTDRRR